MVTTSLLSDAFTRVVVLTATDRNPYYFGFRDMFSTAWRFGDFRPHIVDISQESALHIDPRDIPEGNFAQIVRVLYPALFPEHRFLLSDVDMLPLSRQYFENLIRVDLGGNQIWNFSADAYPGTTRLPICYFYATGETFRKVTGVTDIDNLKEVAKAWWSLGLGWGTDELVFGHLIHNLHERGVVSLRKIKRGWDHRGAAFRRLDRISDQPVIDPIDAHLPRPVEMAKQFIRQHQQSISTAKNFGKKYVSFSLWNDSEIYSSSILANIVDLREVLPDWTSIVYVPKDFNSDIVGKLRSVGGVIVEVLGSLDSAPLWRFLAADRSDFSLIVFSDARSNFGMRERQIILEWIGSEKQFHIIRHLPSQSVPIMARLWGLKAPIDFSMQRFIDEFSRESGFEPSYDTDQRFLESKILPLVKPESVFITG